ncbi:MAG: hypothetical protein HY586_04945, partial [Candidatus Omnitrophica bacterium]|nr:hypothetical protein [Candidatus Omnitrophota bacterium]
MHIGKTGYETTYLIRKEDVSGLGLNNERGENVFREVCYPVGENAYQTGYIVNEGDGFSWDAEGNLLFHGHVVVPSEDVRILGKQRGRDLQTKFSDLILGEDLDYLVDGAGAAIIDRYGELVEPDHMVELAAQKDDKNLYTLGAAKEIFAHSIEEMRLAATNQQPISPIKQASISFVDYTGREANAQRFSTYSKTMEDIPQRGGRFALGVESAANSSRYRWISPGHGKMVFLLRMEQQRIIYPQSVDLDYLSHDIEEGIDGGGEHIETKVWLHYFKDPALREFTLRHDLIIRAYEFLERARIQGTAQHKHFQKLVAKGILRENQYELTDEQEGDWEFLFEDLLAMDYFQEKDLLLEPLPFSLIFTLPRGGVRWPIGDLIQAKDEHTIVGTTWRLSHAMYPVMRSLLPAIAVWFFFGWFPGILAWILCTYLVVISEDEPRQYTFFDWDPNRSWMNNIRRNLLDGTPWYNVLSNTNMAPRRFPPKAYWPHPKLTVLGFLLKKNTKPPGMKVQMRTLVYGIVGDIVFSFYLFLGVLFNSFLPGAVVSVAQYISNWLFGIVMFVMILVPHWLRPVALRISYGVQFIFSDAGRNYFVIEKDRQPRSIPFRAANWFLSYLAMPLIVTAVIGVPTIVFWFAFGTLGVVAPVFSIAAPLAALALSTITAYFLVKKVGWSLFVERPGAGGKVLVHEGRRKLVKDFFQWWNQFPVFGPDWWSGSRFLSRSEGASWITDHQRNTLKKHFWYGLAFAVAFWVLPNFHEYGDFFASKVTEWNNYFRGLDPARYIPDLMGHYIVTGAWKVVVAAYALSWFDVGRDILRISRNVVLLAFLTTLICLPFIVWKPLLILYVVAIYFREGLFPWVTSTTVGLQIKKGHTFRDALFFHIGPMVLWYAPVLAIAIFATVFGVTGIWASFWLLAGTSVYILGLSKITKSIYRQSKERFVLFKIGIVLALLGMTVVTGLLLAYAILPFLGLSSPWFFEAVLGQNVIPAVLEKSIFFKGITIVAALFVGLPTAFLLTETGMSKKLRYPRHISAERELSNRINPPRMGPLLAEKESVDMEMRLLGALGGAPAEQVERLRETQRVLTQRLRSAGATEDGGGNFSPPVFDRDAVVEQILGSEENKGGIAKKYALEDREKTLLYLEALTLFLPEKERIAYDDPLSKLLQKIANRQMHRIWPNITLPFLGHIGDWEGDTFDKKQKVEVLRKYLFSKKSRRFLRNAERRRIVRLYGPVVEKEFFSGAAGGGALRPIRRRPPQAPRPTRSPAQAHSLGSQ